MPSKTGALRNGGRSVKSRPLLDGKLAHTKSEATPIVRDEVPKLDQASKEL